MCDHSTGIIPELLRSKNTLEYEVKMKNEEIKKLRKYLLMSFVVVVFLVYLLSIG